MHVLLVDLAGLSKLSEDLDSVGQLALRHDGGSLDKRASSKTLQARVRVLEQTLDQLFLKRNAHETTAKQHDCYWDVELDLGVQKPWDRLFNNDFKGAANLIQERRIRFYTESRGCLVG